MSMRALELIKDLYKVPEYVEFQLLWQNYLPTRPPPGFIAIYRDFFWKGLQLPFLHFSGRPYSIWTSASLS